MYNISHKYKQPLILIFKLIIVIGAIYFIYQKLISNELLSFHKLKDQFVTAFSNNLWALVGILLFTDANWFLEIFKWKTLVSSIKKITFFEAYQQSLSSLTVSLLTPNRIGEYGAKAIYFEKEFQKKIVGLNFIGNMEQLAATVLFGSFGMFFFISNYNIYIPIFSLKLGLIIFISCILLYFSKKYLFRFSKFLKEISIAVYTKTFIFSITRYLVFSHQFYFLLILFGVEADYLTLISLIFSMYFIASFIPSLSIFDWAIKGSVSVWLFSFIGLNELTVITVTTFMWILNFAIPAIIGSVFVLNFKTNNYK